MALEASLRHRYSPKRNLLAVLRQI
jgi:hypothetical protein